MILYCSWGFSVFCWKGILCFEVNIYILSLAFHLSWDYSVRLSLNVYYTIDNKFQMRPLFTETKNELKN